MRIPGFTAEQAAEGPSQAEADKTAHARYSIRVPGLTSGDIGLGDAVSRAASVVGITPCGGCMRRAQALNAWMAFSPLR